MNTIKRINIFESLFLGNLGLREEHLSSILCYFFDENSSHGLGRKFLTEFVKLLQSPNENLLRLIKDKSSIISCFLEDRVTLDNDSVSRYVDLVIRIKDNNKKFSYYLCIENKIKEGAIETNQLTDQLTGLKKKYLQQNDVIHMVFITPSLNNEKCGEDVFYGLKKEVDFQNNIFASHISWNDTIFSNEKSIQCILNDIITYGEIKDDARLILEQLNDFISVGFSPWHNKAKPIIYSQKFQANGFDDRAIVNDKVGYNLVCNFINFVIDKSKWDQLDLFYVGLHSHIGLPGYCFGNKKNDSSQGRRIFSVYFGAKSSVPKSSFLLTFTKHPKSIFKLSYFKKHKYKYVDSRDEIQCIIDEDNFHDIIEMIESDEYKKMIVTSDYYSKYVSKCAGRRLIRFV